ncbi:nucleoid-associated protein YgaU [Methylobacterium sp. PvP062]|uniref:Nucleoid-associated protein YgaU n=1 Tax=Methylobacterium radiotolerans TaxID=31998 RepID=A0ABV2NAK2_9HYPH|nr:MULTISPECIES: AprI/Inh family metalloprotease inhibitor [unclassified Methylobacterium]MBP2493233.1 nucleoid-associated protein YgaU [Methylobacterium sp. PvP105]MBP2500394.1 nucleoid-associated protein YgaU [Methylobacterium sp. PvP109]MCX7332728.1 AprI/Inh family metalloprotease inhibitor [Hyphomicrobiales bacterium]
MRQAQAALLTASALIATAAIVRPAAAQDVPDATDLAAPPPPAAETLAAPPAPTAPPSLPEKLGQVPGTWDLSRDGTNRRCVMTLVLDSGEAGQRLRFPAGCRRALPVLKGVAGWLFVDGALRLVDRNVRPVLEFARRPDQRSLVAQAEGGERYSLVPLDIVAMRPADAAAAPEIAPADPANPDPSPLRTAARVPAELQPAATASAGPAPGLYALDRFQQRDTCRINLDGSGGGVHIVPGCHDSGLEVFDPVRWRYTNGRMTLTAKRGHSIDLVPSGDGRWRRDPEVGTTFVLRRVD